MFKRLHISYVQKQLYTYSNATYLKHLALSLGLKGYYHQNQQQIEIEVEGKNNSINEFLNFIEKDEDIEELFIQSLDELKGFETFTINMI
jgi:acylphosphatase